MSYQATLAKIHIAKKALNLGDIVYRDCIRAISNGRTESSKDLTATECAKLLRHFENLGWSPKHYKSQAIQYGHLQLLPRVDQSIRHIVRLWSMLGKQGKLRNNSRQAMLAFCARQSGRENLKNLDVLTKSEKSKIIEALKAWLARQSA